MSTSQSLKQGPKHPQRPFGRLDSLKNPQPRPPPQINRPRATQCPNPDCGEKANVLEEDGKDICGACGTVIQELNMVSDLAFGIVSGGQHVLHGFHVAADQAVARRGDMIDQGRSMTSQMITEDAGNRHIVRIGVTLGMPANLRDAGLRIFKLAIGGFIQGRRIKSVAAVALYIACRTQRDSNTHMLIDFADIDVFNLGHVYKKLVDYLRINGPGCIVQPINPEDLILRFCQRLEFETETMRVARDAVRIVQRMDRDWMTPGRRPAGICGAALVLASRMNSYRRTVREVCYVVKVQEQTIFHRLDEFRATESSGLTVEEFRSIDLERSADPPIYAAQHGGTEGKKKRKRKPNHPEFDDDGDNDQPTVIGSRAPSAAPPTSNEQRRSSMTPQRESQLDNERMPPPPLPIDPNFIDRSDSQTPANASPSRLDSEPLDEALLNPNAQSAEPSNTVSSTTKATSERPAKKKRGRPKKTAAPATPPSTQAIDDAILDADITVACTEPENIAHASALQTALEFTADTISLSTHQQSEVPKNRPPIPDTEEILDSEFASDPEVAICLLNPQEVAIKTRIWLHENREYLRAQSAKLHRQKLAEENGTARVIQRRTRKRKRMGDMTEYVGPNGEEGGPVAGSPEEAIMKMMDRRGFSKKLNYAYLKDLCGNSASVSNATSRRPSASATAHNSPGSGGDARSPAAAAAGVEKSVMETPAQEEVAGGAQSLVDEVEGDDQMKELEAIAGELEEEGINEDEDDGEGEEDQYDDDPYEAGGDDSD